MENSKSFARNPHAKRMIIFSFCILTIALSLMVYVFIVEKRFIELLYVPLFLLVPAIIFFIIRKKMFGKIRLNDEGIAFTYKAQVLKEIKWQSIKKISVHLNTIIFSKTEKKAKGIDYYIKSPKDYLIIDVLYSSFIDELIKQLPKLTFKMNIELLNKLDKLKSKAYFKNA